MNYFPRRKYKNYKCVHTTNKKKKNNKTTKKERGRGGEGVHLASLLSGPGKETHRV
jgi:hypothetical protein